MMISRLLTTICKRMNLIVQFSVRVFDHKPALSVRRMTTRVTEASIPKSFDNLVTRSQSQPILERRSSTTIPSVRGTLISGTSVCTDPCNFPSTRWSRPTNLLNHKTDNHTTI